MLGKVLHMKEITNIWFWIKEIWKMRKSMVLLSIIRLIFQTIEPYIMVLFPSMIIEELSTYQRSEIILKYILIMITSYLFCHFMLRFVNHFLITEDMKIGNEFGNSCSERQMTMQYEHCESSKIHNMVSKFYFPLQPEMFLANVARLISSVLQVIICIFVGGIFNWYITVVLLISIILQNIFVRKAKKREFEYTEVKTPKERKLQYISDVLVDYQFSKELHIFYGTTWLSDLYSEILKTYFVDLKIHMKNKRGISFVLLFVDILQQLFFYLVFGIQVIYNGLSIGYYTLYIGFAARLKSALFSLIESKNAIQQTAEYIELYKEYLNIITPNKEKEDLNKYIEKPIILKFVNVSFCYPGANNYALKDISFTVKSGERIALVGLNGSGKSTIIKLICRLYQPTKGEILLNGVNINNYDIKEYYRNLSVLLQDYKTIALTIRENITFGDGEVSDEQLYEFLFKTGIDVKVSEFKEGLDTYLYKDFSSEGIELSGGETQKLVCARELYKGGNILIFDEPTAALDPISEYEFYNNVKNMSQDKVCIYISHRLYSVKFADRIYVIDDGCVVEKGSHEELMQNKSLYYKMFTTQAKMYQ